MRISLMVVTCAVALSICVQSHALERDFTIVLQKSKIAPGRQTRLELHLPKTIEISPPEIAHVEGLDIKFISYSKEALSSKTIIYSVRALSLGEHKVGPIVFEYGGDTYRSNAVLLQVVKDASIPSATVAGMISHPEAGIAGHIFLSVEAAKGVVYVNQRVPLTVRIYTDWIYLENITLKKRPGEQLIEQEFKDREIATEEVYGKRYTIITYRSSFYAVAPGEYTLDPVVVNMEVVRMDGESGEEATEPTDTNVQFYDEFIGAASRRPLQLETKPIPINVSSLPLDGRPESFSGAVGSFQVTFEADKNVCRVGDTVSIKMRVAGDGNYDTIAPPVLKATPGLVFGEVRSTKTKEQITFDIPVKVESLQATNIPKADFSFFDPMRACYSTLSSISMPIEGTASLSANIAPAAGVIDPVKVMAGLKRSASRLRRYDMKWYRHGAFAIFLAVPPLSIIAAYVMRRRRDYLSGHPSYAAKIRARKISKRLLADAELSLAGGEGEKFYSAVLRLMQCYLSERFFMPADGVTESVFSKLRAAGVDDQISLKVRQIFSDCYAARYTRAEHEIVRMNKLLKETRYVIDELDRRELAV